MTLSTGSLLAGRYEITAPIATGGMGEVWKARDQVLDRIVAAKVLRSEYTGDPSFLARFRNEARHTAALTHPNIASVYDYGETVDDTGTQQLAFLVMEFVDGQPLVSILHDEGRLPVDWTLHVLSQSADGLSAAHRAGVVHRDIKPGNLMVRPDGVVKLTDFGIAQARDATPLTRTGMVVGTAQYLSPEQAQGMEVTAASDVYSLGVVAYECLSGARPFDGASQVAIALAHINRPPPPLPAEIPPAVRLLVERALAKDPADRFPDGGAFAEAIRRVAAGGPISAVFPVNAPATAPTRVVGGAADGRTTVFAAATGAVAGAAVVGGPTTGPAGPMPPLQAPEEDDWIDGRDEPPADSGGRRRWLWITLALVALLLFGGIAWALLGAGGDDSGGTDRTTAPATTSQSAPAITLRLADYLGDDGDAAESEIDGLGLDATQSAASEEQIDAAGRELAPGQVAAIDPVDTPLAPGGRVTVFVVPAADDEEEVEQPAETDVPAATTTPPATTTAAPTTTTPPPATTTSATPTTSSPPPTTAGGTSATPSPTVEPEPPDPGAVDPGGNG
jgi:hypothetical protein